MFSLKDQLLRQVVPLSKRMHASSSIKHDAEILNAEIEKRIIQKRIRDREYRERCRKQTGEK